MPELHSLAGRQARKYLTDACRDSPEVIALLEAVSDAYREFDDDRKMVERSLEISSQELLQANEELKKTVSDLQDMQTTLVQSEKMASLGQLTAGIAHEINNPLSFVASNLNRFKEYFDETLAILKQWQNIEPAVRQARINEGELDVIAGLTARADIPFIEKDFATLMGHAQEGVERIKVIVHQLRGFSHLADAEFAEADLNQVIEDTLVMVWNELKYKATVRKEYGRIPPVVCHPGELKQVFVNLFVNAAHAINEHGEIVVQTTHRYDNVVARVSDTGCGIPEENLNRIFDPFFTTKAVGKGTGLGLWISTNIVRKHGGDLTAESTVGKGTTFTVTLPVTGPA